MHLYVKLRPFIGVQSDDLGYKFYVPWFGRRRSVYDLYCKYSSLEVVKHNEHIKKNVVMKYNNLTDHASSKVKVENLPS